MELKLKLENRLTRVKNDFVFRWKFDHTYRNFLAEDGEKNWKAYDDFTIAFTSLDIDYIIENPFKIEEWKSEFQPHVPGLYQHLLQWVYACTQVLRFFPPRFFRHSELINGVMSIHSERLRLMGFLVYAFKDVLALEDLDDYQPLHVETYFFKDENQCQSVDRLVFFLLQESFSQKKVVELLTTTLKNKKSSAAKELAKVVDHYQAQVEFFAKSVRKLWDLEPDMKAGFTLKDSPRLHYLERFPDFGKLAKLLQSCDGGFLDRIQSEMDEICFEYGLGKRESDPIVFERDFTLAKEQQDEYGKLVSKVMNEFSGKLSDAVDEMGKDNDKVIQDTRDKLLRQSYAQLLKPQSFKQQFQTGIYECYTTEMRRIQWHLQDVLKLVNETELGTLTDNDYQLIDVVKEIAFCEGFSYTIGYQNMYHVHHMNPFALWNVQQCHEELKHYHGVRALLNKVGIQTENLDEEFLASTWVEPDADAYHDQYVVFMVNFLGEIHNMRAYWLLHEAFDNEVITQVLQWIFDDEVVHKKIFGMHFNFLKQSEKNWEKNTYECPRDHGLGIHQAQRCPRFTELMRKIGRYYSKSGKTTALDFLNRSFRAQYLEVKGLFSEDVFKMSEYDFRREHLKAYAF